MPNPNDTPTDRSAWYKRNLWYIIGFATAAVALIVAYLLRTQPGTLISVINEAPVQPQLPEGGNPYQHPELQLPPAQLRGDNQGPNHNARDGNPAHNPDFERNANGLGYRLVNKGLQQELDAFNALLAGNVPRFQQIYNQLPAANQAHLARQAGVEAGRRGIVFVNGQIRIINVNDLQQGPQQQPQPRIG